MVASVFFLHLVFSYNAESGESIILKNQALMKIRIIKIFYSCIGVFSSAIKLLEKIASLPPNNFPSPIRMAHFTRRPLARMAALAAVLLTSLPNNNTAAALQLLDSPHNSLKGEVPQSQSDILYQQIHEHGSLIRIRLLQIKDKESAEQAIHSLKQHHTHIVKNFDLLHEIIRKDGYHMSDIKTQMSMNTRLFGTIGILAHDILEHDAYGSEELAALLSEFCPDNYEKATPEHGRAELLLQSQGLSTPSSFVKAEQILNQLYALLIDVDSAQSASAHANIINEYVVTMLEIDAQIKYILSQSDEQEYTFIINKLHLIRHLGSLCRIEIERLRSANFYKNEQLVATFELEKAYLEKIRLTAANPDGTKAK